MYWRVQDVGRAFAKCVKIILHYPVENIFPDVSVILSGRL